MPFFDGFAERRVAVGDGALGLRVRTGGTAPDELVEALVPFHTM